MDSASAIDCARSVGQREARPATPPKKKEIDMDLASAIIFAQKRRSARSASGRVINKKGN
jgi:hypothetical protein